MSVRSQNAYNVYFQHLKEICDVQSSEKNKVQTVLSMKINVGETYHDIYLDDVFEPISRQKDAMEKLTRLVRFLPGFSLFMDKPKWWNHVTEYVALQVVAHSFIQSIFIILQKLGDNILMISR